MRVEVWVIAAAAALIVGCSSGSTKSTMRNTPVPPVGSAERTVNAVESGSVSEDRISREVRRQIVLLPEYGVFDNLAYQVNGSTVTLLGQVTRPGLRTDAENMVKGIEGVEQVANRIEILPLSPGDERMRKDVYAAIYTAPELSRYASQAVPPIHIVVNSGHVALEGVVSSEADKDRAGAKAGAVPGVLSVANHLKVAN